MVASNDTARHINIHAYTKPTAEATLYSRAQCQGRSSLIKGGMLRSGSWTTYKWGNDPLLIDGSVQSVLMGADTTVEFFEDGMFESDSYAVRNF